ncbi:hypothetical protein [uncultured Shewanella sp.]|uniref:hypothetical protein n=1 Tax=uncultured Shewanella sp. TaxID=173975 RepID=UPI00261AB34E|nr:hypothetical protein [uncultured Shewanella sp.]
MFSSNLNTIYVSSLQSKSVDRGSENVRLPRLTLIGEERAYVEQVIAHALETRIDLDKYNID